jgi:hypothetical protein
VYGCPLTERPKPASPEKGMLPHLLHSLSHTAYISLSKMSFSVPVRAGMGHRGRGREKKKAESKEKGDAWCGRKDQSRSIYLPPC